MTKATTTSRAVSALLEILRDTDQAPARRLEACEHVLDFEAEAKAIEEAKAAVLSIAEASETSVDLRLAALKLLRRVEARRVSPGRATSEQDVGIARAVEIVRRRKALVKAGIFPYPAGYADDIYDAADYAAKGGSKC